MASSTKKNQIPFVYRLTFNWIEPVLAFGGAIQSYIAPRALLAIQTPSVQYNDSLHPIFTQLAGGWTLLAFNDAVTLRLTQDVRVWTSLLTAGLLSDIIYTSSLIEDLGPAVFWNPAKWSFIHAFTLLTTIPPLLVKVAFIARVGLGPAWASRNAKKTS